MTKLVFSYSHADEALRDELEKHLESLKRQGLIDSWHDRKILAGQDWKGEIDQNFEDAEVILLLVSPDFIASNYCYEIEARRALERHEDGSAVVIPVILRPCHWHELPFGRLQAATKDGRAVVHYPTLDDGFFEVVSKIRAALPRAGRRGDSEPKGVVPTRSSPGSTRPSQERPRSSRLSITREFSDLERDQAMTYGFNGIVSFIEASLDELKERNPGIDVACRRIDADSAEFSIYRSGKRVASGGLWIEPGRSREMRYSTDGATRGSYNESLWTEDDGNVIGFRPMGLASFGERSEGILTVHGAGEHIWSMLTDGLRRGR